VPVFSLTPLFRGAPHVLEPKALNVGEVLDEAEQRQARGHTLDVGAIDANELLLQRHLNGDWRYLRGYHRPGCR